MIPTLIVWCVLVPPVGHGASAPTDRVSFAVIGDFGTGTSQQYELAHVMAAVHAQTSYDMVLTVGDNIYGGWSPRAIVQRFEMPYRPLLDAGVAFYASLGNHDATQEKAYANFNMQGQRYYTFQRSDIAFFAIDSNYLDPNQLSWLRLALGASSAKWKVAYFHHPIYSSGQRHGSAEDLRVLLEPLFVQFGVQVVFSGHDHLYERVKPQKGVTYFVCGSSGQLRRGNLDKRSPIMAAGFDQDEAFLVVDVEAERMNYRAISRTGSVVDSGEIRR